MLFPINASGSTAAEEGCFSRRTSKTVWPSSSVRSFSESTPAPFSFCFALFPRLSPWQPWQLGTPAKVLPLFYPLGRFERLKTVLMGTNTPHTFNPGLVWQKQARRFSQFELKVGELGTPIHFVCVSAALYHRGHAAAIFPLRWIRSRVHKNTSYVLLIRSIEGIKFKFFSKDCLGSRRGIRARPVRCLHSILVFPTSKTLLFSSPFWTVLTAILQVWILQTQVGALRARMFV